MKNKKKKKGINYTSMKCPYCGATVIYRSADGIYKNNHKIISVRSYQKTFASLLKKIGIEHKGFHSLRHTFATRALECGMDVKTLSEILGHKSPNITLTRYVHSLMEHKKNMMNKIGKLL